MSGNSSLDYLLHHLPRDRSGGWLTCSCPEHSCPSWSGIYFLLVLENLSQLSWPFIDDWDSLQMALITSLTTFGYISWAPRAWLCKVCLNPESVLMWNLAYRWDVWCCLLKQFLGAGFSLVCMLVCLPGDFFFLCYISLSFPSLMQ